MIEINLNGGIVANEGFIHQIAGSQAEIVQSQYVSAWGGIQSAGQAIGQFVRSKPASPHRATYT